MSYENAEPKILKSLNSAGQVLNDSGEVIGESSDYWQRIYNQAEPKPDKILHSDGTIKDSAGNLIQDTTEFNVKKYNQAEPIPAKYLHADGTIDENPGGGSSGGVTKLYAWGNDTDFLYTLTENPSVGDKVVCSTDNSSLIDLDSVSEVSEEGIKTSTYADYFARYTRGDIPLV